MVAAFIGFWWYHGLVYFSHCELFALDLAVHHQYSDAVILLMVSGVLLYFLYLVLTLGLYKTHNQLFCMLLCLNCLATCLCNYS